MKIEAFFTVTEVDPAGLTDATVVVIDVLRATTTVVEALANGARGIYPTPSTEEAVRLAHSLGRDDTLLCGERKGEKVEGFDLGNSPLEFTREAVEGMRLVMSTSNGTQAFLAGRDGARMLPCAFTNLGAVAKAVSDASHLVILCAGRGNRFSLEDAFCAGHLIEGVLGSGGADSGDHELGDGARAARALASTRRPTSKFLAETEGGRALIRIGFGADLAICSELDRHEVVAEMHEQAITLAGA